MAGAVYPRGVLSTGRLTGELSELDLLAPGSHVCPELELVIDGASPLLRRCWRLLDLDRSLPNVQLAPDPTDEPQADHGGPLGDAAQDAS
jgi:hypothetical protein